MPNAMPADSSGCWNTSVREHLGWLLRQVLTVPVRREFPPKQPRRHGTRTYKESGVSTVTVVCCVSVSAKQAEQLLDDGPRRDFIELARAVNARILYRGVRPSRRGAVGRVAGPHIKQSFSASKQLVRGDVCFADGEHLGIPLLAFLFARRKRYVRVVTLGHLVDKPWKRILLAATTRLVPSGTLVVHSQTQLERIRGWLAKSWEVTLIPYQVDTAYWSPERPYGENELPIVLAVGSENRDYDTLVGATVGLPVQVVIAAGSYWARQTAGSGHLPDNVHYLDKPLPFAELRKAYAASAMVVVPIHDVTNQSGVTVILEAMSMARPVIVTASRGQRECIKGPTVLAEGHLEQSTVTSRGPQLFGDRPADGVTGVYVPPGDAAALRSAILHVVANAEQGREMGAAARAAATAHFSIERYVHALGEVITGVAPQPVSGLANEPPM